MLSRYIILFMLYSCMGWIYETVFCTIKGKKWENRGFLFGPVCPIYGTGALILTILLETAEKNAFEPKPWIVFLVSLLGSAILEFVTSWVLEKLFHAVWWDYSRLPLNLQGRISLFTSLGFGLAGLLILYVIAPFSLKITGCLTPLLTEILALILVFLFAGDLTLTVTALKHFDRYIASAKDSFDRSMDTFVDSTVQRSRRIKETLKSRKQSLDDSLDSMGALFRTAVRRVNFFRERDKQKESIKNRFLARFRNRPGKTDTDEKTDEGGNS